MKKYILFLVVTLLLLPTIINAQNIKLSAGLSTGFNQDIGQLNSVSTRNSIQNSSTNPNYTFEDSSYIIGHGVGIDLNVTLFDFLFVRTGYRFNYSIGGETTDKSIITSSAIRRTNEVYSTGVDPIYLGKEAISKQKSSLMYSVIPLTLGVRFGTADSSFYVGGGPALYFGKLSRSIDVNTEYAAQREASLNIPYEQGGGTGGYITSRENTFDYETTGIGIQAIIGYETKLTDELNIYFNLIFDNYYDSTETKINDDSTEFYSNKRVLPSSTYIATDGSERSVADVSFTDLSFYFGINYFFNI